MCEQEKVKLLLVRYIDIMTADGGRLTPDVPRVS
jgi:hypothetical protein